MNTQNVNVKTAASESTERWEKSDNSGLTVPQVYDLFCHVVTACGRSTGTLEPPYVPAAATEFFADFGEFDSISVWVLDGWPIATSDQMAMIHWSLMAELAVTY